MTDDSELPLAIAFIAVIGGGIWLEQHPVIKAMIYFVADHFIGIMFLIVLAVGIIMWKRGEY